MNTTRSTHPLKTTHTPTTIQAVIHEWGESAGVVTTVPVIAFDAAGEALTLPGYLIDVQHRLQAGDIGFDAECASCDGTRLIRISDIQAAVQNHRSNYSVECWLEPS